MNKKINRYILLLLFILSSGREAFSKTLLLDIEGTINPVVADYISSGLSEPGVSSAIIRMDTPGGLMDSMRLIIKEMEAAPFPVIVYVGGSGAHASSAGAFITLAADLAVMAAGTTIGSAHPVQMGAEGAEGVMESKIVEDAAALIRSLAVRRQRNPEWAEKAVTMSLSATAAEALELGVIDYTVGSFEELLELLNGKTVAKHNKDFLLDLTSGVTEYNMSFFRKFLNYIAHPNFTYILMLIGIYGLIYEVTNPGIGIGAVLGGISLLLALLAFQIIPINTAGLLLILLGAFLMFMDIWVPSFGILTAGGLVSFIMGSLTLYDIEEFPIGLSLSLILGAALASGAFFVFAAGSVLRIQFKRVTTGKEGMVGLKGEARSILNPSGEIFVRGELWKGISESGIINPGESVEIRGVEGNTLKVSRAEEEV